MDTWWFRHCRPVGFLLVIGMLVSLGAATVAMPAIADHESYDNAPVTETNGTIELPDDTDHYPGESDDDSASIHYLPSMQPFANHTDEPGLYLKDVEIHSPWLDYSDCHRFENVSAFGIDRDGNADGTGYDRGLVQHTSDTEYRDGRLLLSFFRIDELGGNPPYVSPDDQFVLALGEGSDGGTCVTVTDHPGWYQLEFFANGTVHDDPDDYPSADEVDHEDLIGVTQQSTYVYVCECANESEARETLGPPPNLPNPTPVSTPTPTSTSTPPPEPSPTPTADPAPTAERSPDETSTPDSGPSDEPGTPTERDGAGFTPAFGLLAILASVLLRYHRQ